MRTPCLGAWRRAPGLPVRHCRRQHDLEHGVSVAFALGSHAETQPLKGLWHEDYAADSNAPRDVLSARRMKWNSDSAVCNSPLD